MTTRLYQAAAASWAIMTELREWLFSQLNPTDPAVQVVDGDTGSETTRAAVETPSWEVIDVEIFGSPAQPAGPWIEILPYGFQQHEPRNDDFAGQEQGHLAEVPLQFMLHLDGSGEEFTRDLFIFAHVVTSILRKGRFYNLPADTISGKGACLEVVEIKDGNVITQADVTNFGWKYLQEISCRLHLPIRGD